MRLGRFTLYFLPIVIFCLSECSLLGLESKSGKNAKTLTANEIQKYHKSLKITQDSCYSFLPWFLDSMPLYIDTLSGYYKSLYQPLGYQVYDSSGMIVSIVQDCFRNNLKNKVDLNKRMEVFPPKTDFKISKPVVLSKFLSLTNYPFNWIEKNDFTVLVIYGKWRTRQTKQLIKGVRVNQLQIPKDKKVQYIYLNNDNVFANLRL